MLTMKKYTELKESLLSSYLEKWPDYDIVLPSFQQANEQERNGTLILEAEEEEEGEKTVKVKKEYTDQEIKEIFEGRPEREDLDEKIYWEEAEEEEKAKERVKNFTLTESQQALFDEACGVKKKEIDHSLDEVFAEAFGSSSHKVEILNDIQEAALGNLLLEDLNIDNIIIEEAPGGAFKFRGKALKVGRINRNNRRYRKEIVEKALGEAEGQVMTIRDGHPKKDETSVSPIIGKVEFGKIDAEGWLPYIATLSNTSRSRDIQELLRDKIVGSVSLRSRGRTAIAKMDGESIEDVVDLHFRGLDMVPEGSEQGAGVDEILNSADRGGF